jgi:hypothetical protein
VILVCDQDTDAYIIAVDADSGKIAETTRRHQRLLDPDHLPSGRGLQVIAPALPAHRVFIVDGDRSGSFESHLPAKISANNCGVLSISTVGLRQRRGSKLNCPPSLRRSRQLMPITTGSSQAELPQPWQPTGLACDRFGSGWFSEREGMDIFPRAVPRATVYWLLGSEARRRDKHTRALAL